MGLIQRERALLLSPRALYSGRRGVSRRDVLRSALALGGASWLTPLARALADAAEQSPAGKPAQSLICLWMEGAPSQLETFDPHPGTLCGGPTQAIDTSLRGAQLAAGLPRLAELLDRTTLVRDIVSPEGDHARGKYMMKTGYQPDTTLVHPSLGAIVCHQLFNDRVEIPQHISILPNNDAGRGGLLGNHLDAFQTNDPQFPVPDVLRNLDEERFLARLHDASVVEQAFAAGRTMQADATLHRHLVEQAQKMMTSDQIRAFDVKEESEQVRALYGDTPFGRGCLAARRLIEVGVRCVEVTLNGWDSHINNFEQQSKQCETLDPAIAALLTELEERSLLEHTIVVCAGEFGRTPKINATDGRDHWPSGYSWLVAGGRFRRGHVHGATDPAGDKIDKEQGTPLENLHATILTALGIDPHHVEIAPIGRPIQFSEGKPMPELMDG